MFWRQFLQACLLTAHGPAAVSLDSSFQVGGAATAKLERWECQKPLITYKGARMSHKGSCHCGEVTFEVQGDFESAMECNCSHCSRKGFLLWFVPKSRFAFETGESVLSTYTFNKHAIKHHFCSKCGCAPFGFGAMGGNEMVAINVRYLESLDLSSVKREFVDGRSF